MTDLPPGGPAAPRLSSSQPLRSSSSATPPVAASDATWTPLPNTTTCTTTSTMAAAPEVAYKSGIVKEVPSGDCVRAPRSSSDPPHLSPVCPVCPLPHTPSPAAHAAPRR
jgi:hypothetical protein